MSRAARSRAALRRLGAAPLLAVVLAAVFAAPAQAHVQVTSTVAAPNDPVRFTVLVPGEREQTTRRIELKVPPGVLPFSFEDTPGWKRRAVEGPDGAVDRIVWTGRLAKDGFVRFSFLAGTPERPGVIAWKALQVYADGAVVRWIGAPGSEQPAPVTRIVAGAPRENAGGEGGDQAASGATAAPAVPAVRDTDHVDWVGRGLALAALFVGLAALVLVLRRTGGSR